MRLSSGVARCCCIRRSACQQQEAAAQVGFGFLDTAGIVTVAACVCSAVAEGSRVCSWLLLGCRTKSCWCVCVQRAARAIAAAGGGALGPQQTGTAAAAAAGLASARSGSISGGLPAPLVAGSFLTPPAGPLAPAAVKLAGVMASPAAASLTTAAAGRQQQQQQPPFNADSATAATAAMQISGSQILLGAAAAAEAAGTITDNAAGEVITAPVDVRPGAAVVPFWEPVDLQALGVRRSNSSSGGGAPQQQQQPPGASNNAVGDDAAAAGSDVAGAAAGAGAAGSSSGGKLPLATCLEVAKALQAKGLHLTYRRIPLSRERTPVPSDLTDMLKQMLALPAGVGPLDRSAPGGGASDNAAAMMQEAASAAAAWAGSSNPLANTVQQQQPQQHVLPPQQQRSIVHLVVSRTATGSSARFASAAFATFLAQHTASESRAAASGGPNSPVMAPASRRRAATAAAEQPASTPPAGLAGSSCLANGSSSSIPNGSSGGAGDNNGNSSSSSGGSGGGSSPKSPDHKRMRRTMSDLGEYRVIMSLVRLLPGGMEVKNAVDGAIDRCSGIGNLRCEGLVLVFHREGFRGGVVGRAFVWWCLGSGVDSLGGVGPPLVGAFMQGHKTGTAAVTAKWLGAFQQDSQPVHPSSHTHPHCRC